MDQESIEAKEGIVQDLELLSLPRDRAATVAGVTARQVAYWDRTGLIHPTVEARLSPRRPIRLYDFRELMALMIVAELRTRGISLQLIRRLVGQLRQRGYEQPLTQIRFATHGASVYLQRHDGSWAADVAVDQLVIHEAIDLDPLRSRLQALPQRDHRTHGKIQRRRGTMGFKPLVAGTRVPVETVQRYLDHGFSPAEIVEAYPILVPQDVETVRLRRFVA